MPRRGACGEMHAGFDPVCNHLAMNIEACADVERIKARWRDLLDAPGGPLCAECDIIDARFAPAEHDCLAFEEPNRAAPPP